MLFFICFQSKANLSFKQFLKKLQKENAVQQHYVENNAMTTISCFISNFMYKKKKVFSGNKMYSEHDLSDIDYG